MYQDEGRTKSQTILSILIGLILVALAVWFHLSFDSSRDGSLGTLDEMLSALRIPDHALENTGQGDVPDYVYLQGHAVAGAELTDEDFGIQLTGLFLERQVQELVREIVKRPEGRPLTEFHWRERIQHPMTGYREQSKPVTLSGYLVSSSLVDYLEDGIPIPCDDRRITRIPEYKGEELVCRSDGTFHSQPEGTAEDVGDIRVTFAYLPPGTVSMIARHEGGELSLVADKEGTYLDLIKAGEYSPEELVQIAQGEWVDRASRAAWFSGIVLCLGLFLIVAPLWKKHKRHSG